MLELVHRSLDDKIDIAQILRIFVHEPECLPGSCKSLETLEICHNLQIDECNIACDYSLSCFLFLEAVSALALHPVITCSLNDYFLRTSVLLKFGLAPPSLHFSALMSHKKANRY